MEFFAGFKSDGFTGRNVDFLTRSWVAPDARFAGFHVEDPEATQLDAVPGRQGLLHGKEYRFDSDLRFGFGNSRAIHHFVDDVQLDHANLLKNKGFNPRKARGRCQDLLIVLSSLLFGEAFHAAVAPA